MRVLVVGASGFIGGRIARRLEAAGVAVTCGERPQMDLARDLDPEDWHARLEGIDVVVNAAGVFRDSDSGTLEAVHARGPAALFAACAARGTKVVQLSALGADEGAVTAFHRSKRAGDEALLALDVPSLVLQPALVFGTGGSSARLFSMLASMPAIPVPARGEQRIQPVHVDDVASAVVSAVGNAQFPRARVAAVGPRATTLREFLATLRTALGLGPARFITVPRALVGAASRLGVGLLDRDAWSMLQRGNTADPSDFARLLGREPRAAESFVTPQEADYLRLRARLDWLLPILRFSIAFIWIVAGVVSMGLYPVERSLALLAPVGLEGVLAYIALYGAAALDLALGLATLLARRRRALWLLQIGVILAYTAIITVFLPEQWLHPYGPVAKNVPLLAALLLLHQLEER